MTKTKVELKVRMLQRGVTQEKLAAELGLSREAVSQVIRGKNRTPRIRAAIATALGWPESRIWPDAARKQQTERVA